MRSVFHRDEARRSAVAAGAAIRFCELWTLKEGLFKAAGPGSPPRSRGLGQRGRRGGEPTLRRRAVDGWTFACSTYADCTARGRNRRGAVGSESGPAIESGRLVGRGPQCAREVSGLSGVCHVRNVFTTMLHPPSRDRSPTRNSGARPCHPGSTACHDLVIGHRCRANEDRKDGRKGPLSFDCKCNTYASRPYSLHARFVAHSTF